MQINRRGFCSASVDWLRQERCVCARANASVNASWQNLSQEERFRNSAGLTYINGAFTHPMPIAGVEAVRQHAETVASRRMTPWQLWRKRSGRSSPR